MEADPGVSEDVGRHDGDDHGQIGQETVREEDLAEPAELPGERKSRAEIIARGGHGDAGHVAACDLDQRAAEEVADAGAERGEGKTGHVLVRAESDRKEGIDQTHQQGAGQRAQKRDQDGRQRMDDGRGTFVEEGSDHAADAAHVHDARNTEVQVAGLFRNDLTGRTVEKRNALHDCALKKSDPHYLFSPFSRIRIR